MENVFIPVTGAEKNRAYRKSTSKLLHATKNIAWGDTLLIERNQDGIILSSDYHYSVDGILTAAGLLKYKPIAKSL
jgi:hypothetical protein